MKFIRTQKLFACADLRCFFFDIINLTVHRCPNWKICGPKGKSISIKKKSVKIRIICVICVLKKTIRRLAFKLS